jgi:probable rRNA maturation factor
MPVIKFFSEQTTFKLGTKTKTAAWIKQVIVAEHKTLGNINFIFCSDEYLHRINVEYLNHDTLTDIITFDNSEDANMIDGDIFISIDRVTENGNRFASGFDQELHRVMVHGILHLIGYGDKGPVKKKLMRKKEDAYLSLR